MGIDIFTLNKAKRYTNLVALGLASATVDDVNKSITFTLAADGSQHTIHFDQPSNGRDGMGLVSLAFQTKETVNLLSYSLMVLSLTQFSVLKAQTVLVHPLK